MTHPTAALRAKIRSHNAHAIILALTAFCASVIIWAAAYFFFVAILLALDVAATGTWDEAPPDWVRLAAIGGVATLFLWGVIDGLLHRFRQVSDRPIIGWHLIHETLLAPVRITFAIMGNLGAIRFVSARLRRDSWHVLLALHDRGPVNSTALPALISGCPHPEKVCDLLLLLRLIEVRLVRNEWSISLTPEASAWVTKLVSPETY